MFPWFDQSNNLMVIPTFQFLLDHKNPIAPILNLPIQHRKQFNLANFYLFVGLLLHDYLAFEKTIAHLCRIYFLLFLVHLHDLEVTAYLVDCAVQVADEILAQSLGPSLHKCALIFIIDDRWLIKMLIKILINILVQYNFIQGYTLNMQDEYGSCIIDYCQYKKLIKQPHQTHTTHTFKPNKSISSALQQSQTDSTLQPKNISPSLNKSRLSLSPSRASNIFLQNRVLLDKLSEKSQQLNTYKLIIQSIIDAIAKVYSKQAAQQIRSMVTMLEDQEANINNKQQSLEISFQLFSNPSPKQSTNLPKQNRYQYQNQYGNIGHTIQQIMRCSRCKQLSISISDADNKENDGFQEEEERYETPKAFVVDSIKNSERCTPNKGFKKREEYGEYRKYEVTSHENQLLDTNNNPLKQIQQLTYSLQLQQCSQSSWQLNQTNKQFAILFLQLSSLKQEIQEQINMLKYSKQKIDRQKEKKKLQKELEKIEKIIEIKRRELMSSSELSEIRHGNVCSQDSEEFKVRKLSRKSRKNGERRVAR